MQPGYDMLNLAQQLFPICRSLTGRGVEATLQHLQEHIPLTIHSVPSGTQVFDWIVPNEWNITSAYIEDENGQRIIDFNDNNLHVVGYSTPIDTWLTLDELQNHLHSLPQQPKAIPYITSYYKPYWGFCLTEEQRQQLKPSQYHVVINSELGPGQLTYGEYVIPGQSTQEVFLSTYVCHPSMANNELSGPVVTTFIAKWLASQPRHYTYRIVFIPETIGSITYLSQHLSHLQKNVIAGFNLTCLGDDRTYSYLPSRYGNTYADRIALATLQEHYPQFTRYSFLERGSDERQYCSPGVDLPVVTLCRSKFGAYPEYHTSLDNFDLVTASGLFGSYSLIQQCLELIEINNYYKIECFGEPQLGKRGLYPNISSKSSGAEVRELMNVIAYCDGKNDIIKISQLINLPINKVIQYIQKLQANSLLTTTKIVF